MTEKYNVSIKCTAMDSVALNRLVKTLNRFFETQKSLHDPDLYHLVLVSPINNPEKYSIFDIKKIKEGSRRGA